MKRKTFFGLVMLLVVYSHTGCKKEQAYRISGRVFTNRTDKAPVANYALHIYQKGTAGAIIMGASSSSADGKTDAAGFFDIRFEDGGGFFAGIPTQNNSPVSIYGDRSATGPELDIYNYPLGSAREGDTLFLYKKIDTVYVRMRAETAIVPSDTFTVSATGLTGFQQRVRTGFIVPANDEVLLDTIVNAVFTRFDYQNQRYNSSIGVSKNKRGGLPQDPLQESLLSHDEKSRTFLFLHY